jgi:ubiquinone/menaquinone biosynthesis C-methylase UbiE
MLEAKICKTLNRIFPLPVHPFNLQNDGVKSYAEWQYDKGLETIRFFLVKYTAEVMFKDKVVLDIGCGAAGKTLFYASYGTKMIYGIDVLEEYREESHQLALKKGLDDRFRFIAGDAAALKFEDGFFDTIIINDAMEHVSDPLSVLRECFRVLKKGGNVFLNFPPYYHPYGAHLSDVIGIPWVHAFFRDKALIEAYKELSMSKPDGVKRIKFRISRNEAGEEYFSYINKMTISRFDKLLPQTDFELAYRKHVPLRQIFSIPAKMPVLKEFMVKMVVCVLNKS